MDILHDYTTALLSFYIHTLEPASRPVRSLLSSVYTSLSPVLTPALDSFVQLLHESPAWAAVGILLLTLLISLQVLNMMRRMLMWWTRLLLRLVFWGGLIVLGMVVWQRGPEKTAHDLMGWGQEVRTVWWREYRRWEGVSAQGKGSGRGGGGGYGGYSGAYGNR